MECNRRRLPSVVQRVHGMGHQRLGVLPRSRAWQQVIALITEGGDVESVAAETSQAAEASMIDASADPAVRYSFWLLTQIPLAARQDNLTAALERLGLANMPPSRRSQMSRVE